MSKEKLVVWRPTDDAKPPEGFYWFIPDDPEECEAVVELDRVHGRVDVYWPGSDVGGSYSSCRGTFHGPLKRPTKTR